MNTNPADDLIIFLDKFQGLLQMKDAATAQSAKLVLMKIFFAKE